VRIAVWKRRAAGAGEILQLYAFSSAKLEERSPRLGKISEMIDFCLRPVSFGNPRDAPLRGSHIHSDNQM